MLQSDRRSRSKSQKTHVKEMEPWTSPRPIVPRFLPLHLSLILMCCHPWNSTSLKVKRIRVWRVNTLESQSKGLQKMLTFVTFLIFFTATLLAAAASPQPAFDIKWRKSVYFSVKFDVCEPRAEPRTWTSFSSLLLRFWKDFSVALTLRVKKTLSSSFLLHCSEKCGCAFQQHLRRRLCRRANQRWFQGLGSFLLHPRPTFSPPSANAAWCFNGWRSPSCIARAPSGFCSIQQPNGLEREGDWKWQRKTVRQADKVHACESPVVLWPGCRNVEAFSSTLHRQRDSIWHLVSLLKCIYRSVLNSGTLPIISSFIFKLHKSFSFFFRL